MYEIPIQKIDAVRANDDHTLTVTFQNGDVKLFDVSPYLNASEFFHELADVAYFRQAFSDGSSVEWPHGQSLCTDTLFPSGVAIEEPPYIVTSQRIAGKAV